MNLEYNEEQVKILKERLSFLHEVKTICTAILVICLLTFAIGPLLIYFSLPLIGVLVSLIIAFPVVVAAIFLSYACKFSRSLKHGEYKVYRITYNEYEKMPGTQLWYKVVTSEGNIEVFYYRENPEQPMPAELDIMVCKGKTPLMVAYDVI